MGNKNNLSWQEALEKLKKGNENFVHDRLEGKNQDSTRRNQLTGSQHPFAIVISCADSRVVPELTFDVGLGEIFVIRVAGNVANISSIASIEYAVAHLGVNLIIALGHESCGAVTAAIEGKDNGYNLNVLTSYIKPAVKAIENPMGNIDLVVKKNAEFTARDLKEKSPIIKGALAPDGLKIIPAYYHLKSGKVDFMEKQPV